MEYYLNVIKEITVTDSFLSSNEQTRGCQEESVDECTTRKYRKTFLNQCNCLPFQLRLNEEVYTISKKFIKTNFILQFPLCTAEHLDCVSSIKVDFSKCLQQCSGIQVTSKTENRLSSVVSGIVEYLSKTNGGFEKFAKELPGSCSNLVIL